MSKRTASQANIVDNVPAKASILKSADVAFPRGGALALTPLEVREVANQAARDVLFETAQEKDAPKKKKKKTKAQPETTEEKEKSIPVEYLSFKNVVPGASVLGRVVLTVGPDIVLSLGDGLVGYVPLGRVSAELSKLIEASQNSDGEEEEDSEPTVLPEVSSLAHVSQWLRAVVVEPSPRPDGKPAKKRIELSIEPEIVNSALEDEDYTKGRTVQASVRSVEDHGLVLNIGHSEISGFISKKSVQAAGFNMDKITEGQVFLFTVSKPLKGGRVVSLEFPGENHGSVERISSLEAILPGDTVEMVVNTVGKGVTGRVFGSVNASITMAGAGIYSETGLSDRFEIGTPIKAKVIASVIVTGEPHLVLLMASHVMALSEPTSGLEQFPVGFTIERALACAFDGHYVYFTLGSGELLGHVHVSKLPQKDIKNNYAAGTLHTVRVVDFLPVERLFVLTLDPTLLKQKYLRVQDIPVGETFSGVVESVSSEGMGLRAFGAFSAFVPPKQISDIKLVYPERKYKVGSTVKARVLIAGIRKLVATTKKLIVGVDNIFSQYSDIKVGDKSTGTVETVYPNGAVVSFFGSVRGFLPKSEISEAFVRDPREFLKEGQAISVTVILVDAERQKMALTMKTTSRKEEDGLRNLQIGRSIISAKVVEKLKEGLVVDIEGESCRGIIDAAQLSDGNYEQNRQIFKKVKTGDEIKAVVIDKNRKAGLAVLLAKELLISDAKSEVLPLEFSDIEQAFSLGKVLHGYVKSVTSKGVFVAFSGRLVGLVLSKYATSSANDDIEKIYRPHQSIEVRVLMVDRENTRFLLSLGDKMPETTGITDHDSDYALEVGATVPGRIKRVTDHQVHLQLVQRKFALCHIADALLDYDKKLQDVFKLGQIVDAHIIGMRGHKFVVSLRKDEDVVDREIRSVEDVKVGDVVRGFVKNVTEQGLYVALGGDVFALVRVSDILDTYVKNWRSGFVTGQLVKGRVIQARGEGRILMTMKESQMTGELKLSRSFDELEKGEILDGVVRNVTDFGVFVTLDGTNKVSGLAHRSEISDDGVVEGLKDLFGEGDRVKVKILAIDAKKKQLSLGMKASYFTSENEKEDLDEDEEMLDAEEDEEELKHMSEDESESEPESAPEPEASESTGLSINGFDWTASILDQAREDESDEEDQQELRTKKKKSRGGVTEDRTADIATRAPQLAADFERLLIGEPNSSVLWMNYMAFQLQLSEVEKAREIGARALKTIGFREEQEKLNIWIALLNLENSFGTPESLKDTFQKACQHMDSLVVHQKLAGIYILSDKFPEAEELFKTMAKKFGSELSVWIGFGKFYLEQGRGEDARELLARALKSLPKTLHVEIVKKFAQMEFKIGDAEQGRSLFEGLISDKPKRYDLWSVYIDQEVKKGEKEKVEALFERVVEKKLSNKQRKFFFTKWLQYEEAQEDEKACDYVKAKAREIAEAAAKESA